MAEQNTTDFEDQHTRRSFIIGTGVVLGAVFIEKNFKPDWIGLRPTLVQSWVNPELVDGIMPQPFIQKVMIETDQDVEKETLYPYDVTATLPIPDRYSDVLKSPYAIEQQAKGRDIFARQYSSRYGNDSYVLECSFFAPVQVAEGEGIWETLVKGYGLSLDTADPIKIEENYQIIQAGIEANIERGYLESEDQVVHPGHMLLPFDTCVKTYFSTYGGSRVERVSMRAIESPEVQPHLWVRDPETDMLRAARSDSEAFSL